MQSSDLGKENIEHNDGVMQYELIYDCDTKHHRVHINMMETLISGSTQRPTNGHLLKTVLKSHL